MYMLIKTTTCSVNIFAFGHLNILREIFFALIHTLPSIIHLDYKCKLLNDDARNICLRLQI